MTSSSAVCSRAAYRRCTQTSLNPWISDDILNDAFNRFYRVSHTTRRYGSNVPGPLEARRRLAKRRMGAMTAGGNIFHDIGGIFLDGPPRQDELDWSSPDKDIEEKRSRSSRLMSDFYFMLPLTVPKFLPKCKQQPYVRHYFQSSALY